MCWSWLKTLFKHPAVPVLPHPEELPNPTATLENTQSQPVVDAVCRRTYYPYRPSNHRSTDDMGSNAGVITW
jgi:hypothetical protein